MSPDNIFECSEQVYYKKEVKNGQNQPKCNKAIKFREKTWLKTFSLKALELYTFILTFPLHKSIHNIMIPKTFGYTTKLFY